MSDFFSSPIASSIIGLLLTYALVSAFSSSLIEAAMTMLKQRPKALLSYINTMLDKPNEKIINELYKHPLINSLNIYSDNTKPHKNPTYIEPKNFAKALYDIVSDPEVLNDKNLFPPDNPATQYLKKLINKYNDREKELFEELENWFRTSMDRFSGTYKKNSQKWIFILSLIFSLLLGLDSFRLSKIYWNMPSVDINNLINIQYKSLQNNQVSENPTQNPKSDAERLSDLDKSIDRAKTNYENLNQLPIHFLWLKSNDNLTSGDTQKSTKSYYVWQEDRDEYNCILQLVFYILGCLVTALSTLFGAPLLFDVLNKFVNLRGAGKKPEEK